MKRTIYFGNPAYISLKLGSLMVEMKESGEKTQIPVSDIGVLILDNYRITLTQGALAALAEANAVVIVCNAARLPVAYMQGLDCHHLHQKKTRAQIEAGEALKKRLWAQTVKAKIRNQGAHLAQRGRDVTDFVQWEKDVRAGDPKNHEARAAAAYWPRLFEDTPAFRRDPDGAQPNALLNYAYALLRAATARALLGAGLFPLFGIFHQNQYNAYPLADDIMEPYRPWADRLVRKLWDENAAAPTEISDLTPELKRALLEIFKLDCKIEGEVYPLMLATQRTAAGLAACFMKERNDIPYPVF